MRTVPCLLVLACIVIGNSGCQLFNKKNGSGGDSAFMGAPANGDKNRPGPPSDPLAGASPTSSDLDGLIAGQVIDTVGRPADAQIRWVCLDDPKEEEAPIDVAVNSQGYFMIQGLKSGKQYKLIVRAKSGDKTLEKVQYTKAPNVHVLIKMDDRFAVTAPPAGKDSDKAKKSAGKAPEQPASAQFPTDPGAPNPDWLQPPPVPKFTDKTKIAEQENLVVKPPIMDLKAGAKSWQPAGEVAPAAGNGSLLPDVRLTQPQPHSTLPTGPAPVPSCVRVGTRIENFALNDISLAPWELKTHRHGRLVLLDFWRTSCPPCLQAIPSLRILQDKYGALGLEVVGVAYEDSGTALEQAHKVTKVAQYYQTNYQLLLGGGPKCPLKRDLEIRYFPTMVLLDESGAIAWRHEGALERVHVEELEFAVKRRLVGN